MALGADKFLDLVLPAGGQRCLTALRKDTYPYEVTGPNNAFILDNAPRHVADKRDVYIGCASYRGDKRGKDHVHSVRSLWMDIDCGLTKDYPDAVQSAAALQQFLAQTPLKPTLVSSGYGWHVWFPLDQDIDRTTWERLAQQLHVACQAQGLKVDRTRATDVASILRLPGTVNFKRGARAPVVCRGSQGVNALADVEALLAPFAAFSAPAAADTPLVLDGERPANLALLGPAQDVAPRDHTLKDATLIADRCLNLSDMRRTRGQVSQPVWYNLMSVLAACVDGERLAHEWSAGYPHYSKAETSNTFGRASARGPSSCETFRRQAGTRCEECVLHVTNPIQLGEPDLTVGDEPLTVLVGEDGEETALVFPHGFSWRKFGKTKALYWYDAPKAKEIVDAIEGEEAKLEAQKTAGWTPFCTTLFYPCKRISHAGYQLVLEVQHPRERFQFELPTSMLGKGGAELFGELARWGITSMDNMKPHIERYLTRWKDQLMAEEAIVAQDHFGWVGDAEENFLIGSTLITAAGQRTAHLMAPARSLGPAYQPKGDLDSWKALVDEAYNAPGQEAYQFNVLLSFASPLFALFGSLGGVTVHAFTDQPGAGKTSAQRAGLSVWGDYNTLQLSQDKITFNALWAQIGAAHNLPVMFDELTLMAPEDAANLVFSVSAGRQKQRMQANGDLREVANWRLIMVSNGNNPLSGKIASHRANSEAELSRLFEYELKATPHLDLARAQVLFTAFLDHYGHAGVEFMTYVVQHKAEVRALLMAQHEAWVKNAQLQPRERFWAALLASVQTAGAIAVRLGLVGFDLKALSAWCGLQLQANRRLTAGNAATPVDLFSRMLAELRPEILVTDVMGDARKGLNYAAQLKGPEPRGAVIGRIVLSTGTLYLAQHAVRDWCSKNGTSDAHMLRDLQLAGRCNDKLKQIRLGTGLPAYPGERQWCWVISIKSALQADDMGDGDGVAAATR